MRNAASGISQHVGDALQPVPRFEETDGLGDGHFQHLVDVLAVVAHLEDVRLEALALALRAAHVQVAQELHLDLLEADAAAAFAASVARVERERPRATSPAARASSLVAKSSRTASNTPRYTTGLERGVLESGVWSTMTTVPNWSVPRDLVAAAQRLRRCSGRAARSRFW